VNHSTEIISISPLPILLVGGSDRPSSGTMVPLSSYCSRKYEESNQCKEHYAKMGEQPLGKCVQCPHGFSSCAIEIGSARYAFTGFVPFPRQGGAQEKLIANTHPRHKVSKESLTRYAECLQNVYDNLLLAGEAVIRQYSFALHEIRKMNRNVKQNVERIIMEKQSGHQIEDAALTSVYKAAEMMSRQFDVIEFIANESMAKLPLKSTSNLYQLFDKCAHMYTDRKIVLRSTTQSDVLVSACDKTLPIIPTVLLQNAMKYSLKGSDIEVDIGVESGYGRVRVQNRVVPGTVIDQKVFIRGFRGVADDDGSGHGLYLAEKVASQHHGTIEIASDGKYGVVGFVVRIPLLQ
jgi:hypothetical protein